ncbi:hypothetical protein IWQ60_007987 [Tieghemiomyces parasiticus]|uniref:Glutathione hydrolase n=1 Tax=Tieghemiomyces parasiticus TaxID=78921 RepID=A0A9W8DP28_9FUNG|nr:hypothetical protein IWQ60_007987 [Tieghemiomyces parasiticus]
MMLHPDAAKSVTRPTDNPRQPLLSTTAATPLGKGSLAVDVADSAAPTTPPPATSRFPRPLLVAFLAMAFFLTYVVVLLRSPLDHHHARDYTPYASTPVTGHGGMVSAENPTCSHIGADILRQDGSAVDAAIAAALCIGVVHSFSSGIGGGGFALVRNATDRAELVDFRETAPAAATVDMYQDDITLAQVGGLAVAVPGEIRGFALAHHRYGRLPWADLFRPAIRLARDGFTADKILDLVLQRERDLIFKDPGFRESYTVDGRLIRQGDTVYRSRLAATLETVAREGADAFYTGRLAHSMVAEARRRGGIITTADFAGYSPLLRPALRSTYRGRTVVTGPPPTSGPVLLLLLNTLELLPFTEGPTYVNYQRLIEAFKFAYAKRTFLGDPDFVNIANHTARIVDKDLAVAIRRNITDDHTHPVDYYSPDYDVQEPHGTTHISILDRRGQAVSLTTTVNLAFGSKVMDPVSGVILNNEMDDFSTQNKSNAFGYYPSPNNKIVRGKRPLSSSVPVILEQGGQVQFVAGASGGSRIISAVAQVLVNTLDFNLPLNEAVDRSRLHHQLIPHEGVSPDLVSYLQRKGHQAIYRFSNGTVTGGQE